MLPPIVGVRQVRIPVSEVEASRDWYTSVLGFESILELEEEQGVVGAVLLLPGGFLVGIHKDPARSAALRGFAVLGLTVRNRSRLEAWSVELDRMGLPHGPLEQGHLGWYLDLTDPDGILIRLHTAPTPDSEEA